VQLEIGYVTASVVPGNTNETNVFTNFEEKKSFQNI